jgi:hypothetical protein
MPQIPKKKIFPTLLTAGLMVFILGQNHAGFMLYVVVVPLLIWIPYSVYLMFRRPDVRASQLARVTIWMVAIALVAGIHYIRHKTTRQNADEIVAAINNFSTTHGRCPETIDEIGINQQQLMEKLGLSGYACKDGNPRLFYAVTYVVFDTYDYDFGSGAWKYDAD